MKGGYLRWPERSNWPDTLSAVSNGTLIKGKYYKFNQSNYKHSGYESVTVSAENGQEWGLGLAAFDVKPKFTRNLPSWF